MEGRLENQSATAPRDAHIVYGSALDLIEFASTKKRPSFASPAIDEAIGRALQAMGIIEIFGRSSSGKTSLTMQIVLQFLVDNPQAKAIFIYADGGHFSIQRMEQIFNGRYAGTHHSFEEVTSRIIVENVSDLEEQEHFICFFLEPLLVQQNIGIVVIDSISGNFRPLPRTRNVTLTMYRMANTLNALSFDYLAAVICINQVVDIIKEDSPEGSRRQQSSPEDCSPPQGHGRGSVEKSHQQGLLSYKPALGLSWSNSISTRILIARQARPSALMGESYILPAVFHIDEALATLRRISILQSPLMGLASVDCTLTAAGFDIVS